MVDPQSKSVSDFLATYKFAGIPDNSTITFTKDTVSQHDFSSLPLNRYGFTFEECVFPEGLRIANVNTIENYLHHFTFKNCSFLKEVVLYRNKLNHTDIIQCILFNALKLETNEINNFQCSILKGDRIYVHGGGKYQNLHFGYWDKQFLDNITIEFDGFEGNLTISKSFVNSISFLRTFNKGSITVYDTHSNSFLFSYFNNYGKISLKRLYPLDTPDQKKLLSIREEIIGKDKVNPHDFTGSYFTIYESYLGDTIIYDLNFKSFDEFNVVKSIVSEIKFVNVIWPDSIGARPGRYTPGFQTRDEIQEHDLLPFVKENYKQLRHASNKQGDVLREMEFHEKEMNTYEQELKGLGHFWTIAILKASRMFGNYGKNFSRPFVSLLLIHSVFLAFLVGLWNYDCYTFTWPTNHSWQTFWKFWGEYFRLLNPVHSFDNNSGLWIVADTSIRIYTSYFIYNMLRATRRFVR